MAHSYLLGGALAGLHVRIGAPAGFQPDPAHLDRAQTAGGRLRAAACRCTDVGNEAVAGADVVATDTWVSMGQESAGARPAGDLRARTR